MGVGGSPPVGMPIKAIPAPGRGDRRVAGAGGNMGNMQNERIAGIDASGRGGLHVGDPTQVVSSESLELERMQTDLIKEQKRLEDIVKSQQQQLSSLQLQIEGGGVPPSNTQGGSGRNRSSPTDHDSVFGRVAPGFGGGNRGAQGRSNPGAGMGKMVEDGAGGGRGGGGSLPAPSSTILPIQAPTPLARNHRASP